MTWRAGIPHCRADRRKADAGYLLVEVLATMTISAFILSALSSVVFFTIRTSDRVDRNARNTENVSRVMASLTREIERAAPLRWAGQGAGFVFHGSDQDLVFARESLAADGMIDDRAVILQSKGSQLFLSEAPLLPAYRGITEITAIPPSQMLDAPFKVRFAYFSKLDNGLEALTVNWTNPAQMPVAVRVSITDNEGLLVASTRIQLRIDAEPGCAAPAKAACSLSTIAASGDARQRATETPVNAEDSLGWERYAK